MELTIINIPRRDKRVIIGYSNLLFFISTMYLFDINNTKKVDTRIKTFEYNESLSITKLSLKIFIDSLSMLKINRRVMRIVKIENL